jgi:rhodanese-related sulfurtransferase
MPDSLSPRTLRENIETTEPMAVIDVRESLDYVRGHLRESTWVPRRALERRLPDLVPNRATPVVVCDDDGARGELDARWLERLGYERVSFLAGGVTAWRRAGFEVVEAEADVHATAFNYGSKLFGEEVAASRELPKLSPDELAERRDEAVIVDVRSPSEYERYGTIPGSINVEGVDLALYADELRDEDQPVVVHCAGRTRSIIGTATLQELGVTDVYELENGTMGWQLAGYELAEGSGGVGDLDVDTGRYERLGESAERLLDRTDVSFRSPDELAGLEADVDDRQPVYRFDVRTEAEFESGHVPGSLSIPGGQLLQTADRHVAVRDAEIVVVSETHVRAAITAFWLDRMGFPNVSVLRGGTRAWRESGRRLVDDDPAERLGAGVVDRVVERISPERLSESLRERDPTVVNVDEVDAYAEEHVPGAAWIPRADLEGALEGGLVDADGTVVLTCADGRTSENAAAQVATALGFESVVVLDGGVAAWRAAGFPTEAGRDRLLADPRRATPKPYAQGRRAMELYLEWEANLVEE